MQWTFIELALVAVLSFTVAFAYERWRRTTHRLVPPHPGVPFRISVSSVPIRTRFRCGREGQWWFDPPLANNVIPALEAGQTITGEYAAPNGLLRFRSQICKVQESGQFSIDTPQCTLVRERRSEPRQARFENARIEDRESICINLSPVGGRFETSYPAKRGERIRLELPRNPDPVFGWVLETYPNQVRVRFEERIRV